MKICPSCQGKYADDKKFCRQCGVHLIIEKASSPDVIAKRHIFEAKIAQAPDNTEILKGYGDFLLSIGLLDDALIQYFKALEIDPEDRHLRMRIIEAYHGSKRYNDAIAQLLIIMDAYPEDMAAREKLVAIYVETKKYNDALLLLRQMCDLQPSNHNYLAQRMDILRHHGGREKEIFEISEILFRENPSQYPACYSYIGISEAHKAKEKTDLQLWVQAENLLQKSIGTIEILTPGEKISCKLYLYWCYLNQDKHLFDILNKVKELENSTRSQKQKEILADCFLLIGNAQLQSELTTEAIESYESALSLSDTQQVRQSLSKVYLKIGNELLGSKKFGEAVHLFQEALNYQPDDAEIQACFSLSQSKSKKKNLIISVFSTSAVIAVIMGLFFYYGQSAIEIECNQTAMISINKDNKLIESKEGNILQTSFLRYGSYNVRIDKEGYESVNDEIKFGFGRRVIKKRYDLKPLFVAKKVPQDTNSTTVEKKHYSEKPTSPSPQTTAAADSSASIPMHRVGDTFVTEVTKIGEQKPVISTERRIVSVDGDKIVVESMSLLSKKKTVRVLEFTHEWNLLRTANPTDGDLEYSPPLQYCNFPLFPGKKWQQKTVERNSKTGMTREHILSATVGDWEMVTVPAGTFRAIKIDTATEIRDSQTGGKKTGRDISWYAPDVRKSIKTIASSIKDDGTQDHQEIHLLSFRLY